MCGWDDVAGTSGLDLPTSWHPIPIPRWVEAACGIVHVLDPTSAHQSRLLLLLIYNCHPVEVVVSEVEVLARFFLHVLLFDSVLSRQLLDLEAFVFVGKVVVEHLGCRLLIEI